MSDCVLLMYYLIVWLIDGRKNTDAVEENPLLKMAAMFSGGSGNTAEHVEDILRQDVHPI